MHLPKPAYLFLRLPVAFSMLGHGLVRLPKLQGFSAWMVGSMEKSFLPAALIKPFSYAVPIAELLIGLMLVLGLGTRIALYAGLALMSLLIFGSTSIENWEPITSQLVHAGYMGMLLLLIRHNYFSVDAALNKR